MFPASEAERRRGSGVEIYYHIALYHNASTTLACGGLRDFVDDAYGYAILGQNYGSDKADGACASLNSNNQGTGKR
jgi:hypothetical protein